MADQIFDTVPEAIDQLADDIHLPIHESYTDGDDRTYIWSDDIVGFRTEFFGIEYSPGSSIPAYGGVGGASISASGSISIDEEYYRNLNSDFTPPADSQTEYWSSSGDTWSWAIVNPLTSSTSEEHIVYGLDELDVLESISLTDIGCLRHCNLYSGERHWESDGALAANGDSVGGGVNWQSGSDNLVSPFVGTITTSNTWHGTDRHVVGASMSNRNSQRPVGTINAWGIDYVDSDLDGDEFDISGSTYEYINPNTWGEPSNMFFKRSDNE